jgi:tRNA G18 (ribose-2'-O)-methylase SpoU
MPRIFVSSPDDPRLSDYQQLNERNLIRQSGRFIAEGDKVVERLLASRYEVASLLADESWADRLQPLLPPDTPVYVAPQALIEQTIGFNFHRGVLAAGRRGNPLRLSDVLTGLGPKSTIVVCHDIHDPSNLGTLIRTAAAFGVSAILLGRECAYAFSRRVLRVSMGAVLQIPVIESSDLHADLRLLGELGFEIVATVLDPTAKLLREAKRGDRLAILFGSEGHGLGESWLAHCSQRVTLPMHGNVDSLNVAVASAVFLYHFMGQDAH